MKILISIFGVVLLNDFCNIYCMKNGYTREDARQLINMPIGDAIELLKEIRDIKLSQDCIPTFKLEENNIERFNKEMYHNSQLKTAIQIAIERLERDK